MRAYRPSARPGARPLIGPPLRRTVRRFPDLDLPHSDDPHVLRSQLLQMKAKMKEYANKAEAACYEVCSALLRGAGPAPPQVP